MTQDNIIIDTKDLSMPGAHKAYNNTSDGLKVGKFSLTLIVYD